MAKRGKFGLVTRKGADMTFISVRSTAKLTDLDRRVVLGNEHLLDLR